MKTNYRLRALTTALNIAIFDEPVPTSDQVHGMVSFLLESHNPQSATMTRSELHAELTAHDPFFWRDWLAINKVAATLRIPQRPRTPQERTRAMSFAKLFGEAILNRERERRRADAPPLPPDPRFPHIHSN